MRPPKTDCIFEISMDKIREEKKIDTHSKRNNTYPKYILK